MARPAAAKTQEGQSAALDARLRALFDAIAAEPTPVRLQRHVEALEAEARTEAKKR